MSPHDGGTLGNLCKNGVLPRIGLVFPKQREASLYAPS